LSRIHERFAQLRARGEKALVLFFTAGDQPLEELPLVVATLEEAGADLIEVGIPFSDPFGEGPTIQASSQRALDRGTTHLGVLSQLAKCQTTVPLVTMGYYNNYWSLGLEEVARRSAESGVSGAIISDLVPDEGDAWCSAASANGLDTIFLVAPTSTDQRISDACKRTTGFVYAVSRTGVTGAENAVPQDVNLLVDRVKAQTDLPVCVGFGISSPEHVASVCRVADGAVVGSFVVDLLRKQWPHGRETIVAEIGRLKQATTQKGS
jgi:tryptophan synthase alpha chain